MADSKGSEMGLSEVLAKFDLQDETPSDESGNSSPEPDKSGNTATQDVGCGGKAENKIFFAAIDLGTSFSGWAFATRTDLEKIPPSVFVKSWYSEHASQVTAKTPTCVLMKPDGETLEGFGYDAERKYEDLVSEGRHKDYYYFKNFKTGLYGKYYTPLNLGMTLIDQFGKNLPAINVISSSIKYLADDMFAEIEKRNWGVRKDDIQWIITVPAIWKDPAKYLMRESSVKAGLSSDSIIIALEPEAASVCCRQLDLRVVNRDSGVALSSLEVGSKYLVLDAGGGTIDLTVHEVEPAQCVKQVVASSGNTSGGNTVNSEFEKFLSEAVSDRTFQEFKQRFTGDWLYLTNSFEQKKKSFDPSDQKSVILRFPLSLKEMYEKKKRESFLKKLKRKNAQFDDAVRQTSYGTEVEVKRDKIVFSADMFRHFFRKAIGKTITEIEKQLGEVQVDKIACILMVGGFSECKLLQQAVIDAFPVPVVVPVEASTVVLRGAVIYGHNPPVISERVVRYTYGVSTTIPFIEDLHPIEKRLATDTGVMCKDIFDKHVSRGQRVKTGEPQKKQTYCPVYRRQENVAFSICATKLPNPIYTTEKDCHVIGRAVIMLSETDDACNETVVVSFAFGGTEIVVTAVEEKTGREVKTKISFLE